MISALISGALLGLVLAMPPGPIAMANIRLGLERHRKDCVYFSIGTATMDMIYCLIAITAASAIHTAVSGYFDANPMISLIFQFGVIAGLIYFGILQFKSRNMEGIDKTDNIIKRNGFLSNLMNKGPLFLGISLAFTNLANPTFIPSLTIMSAWVQKVGLFPNGLNQNLFFSLGFGIGNFIWLYLLSMIVLKNRHKLSDGSIARIKQFAGATFIGFGGFIGYRVIMFTNWANIFKYAVVF